MENRTLQRHGLMLKMTTVNPDRRQRHWPYYLHRFYAILLVHHPPFVVVASMKMMVLVLAYCYPTD
jgi:hypothetical protein